MQPQPAAQPGQSDPSSGGAPGASQRPTHPEEAPASGASAVRARFDAALAAVLARLRADPYVLAVILFGSLAHDVVWEKSDIDLLLVVQEGARRRAESVSLVEGGVTIHALILPRGDFRRLIEGSLQGSFMLSAVSLGRLLHCTDPSLTALFADAGGLGGADRQAGLLRSACSVLGALAKAEKWYRTRGDMRYAFFWIMKAVDGLADIETIWNGEVPGREVVQQALRHNPEFFGAIYTELIDGPKTPAAIGGALARIGAHLRDRERVIFAPVLEYLAAADGPRSASEIRHHFARQLNLEDVEPACEWLADRGLIARMATPVRISERSRVDLPEAAYQSLSAEGEGNG